MTFIELPNPNDQSLILFRNRFLISCRYGRHYRSFILATPKMLKSMPFFSVLAFTLGTIL